MLQKINPQKTIIHHKCLLLACFTYDIMIHRHLNHLSHHGRDILLVVFSFYGRCDNLLFLCSFFFFFSFFSCWRKSSKKWGWYPNRPRRRGMCWCGVFRAPEWITVRQSLKKNADINFIILGKQAGRGAHNDALKPG